MTDDVVVRLAKLPNRVKGFVSPSPDGWMNVYVNDKLFPEQMREVLVHELHHVENGDFHSELELEDMEAI